MDSVLRLGPDQPAHPPDHHRSVTLTGWAVHAIALRQRPAATKHDPLTGPSRVHAAAGVPDDGPDQRRGPSP